MSICKLLLTSFGIADFAHAQQSAHSIIASKHGKEEGPRKGTFFMQ